MTGEASACRDLAAYLTGSEARILADRLDGGQPLSMALRHVSPARAQRAKALLRDAGLGADARGAVKVLRAIEGAHAHGTSIGPVWTAPANLAQHGQLTASIHHYVDRARESVTCSTFNFQRSSALWTALRSAAERTEVKVRIYMDSAAADDDPAPWKPTTGQVAAELPGVRVFRTRMRDGQLVRNHAKFVAVDHQFLVVTSANFSTSAELYNVELGLVIGDRILTESIERQMMSMDGDVYEEVVASARSASR